MRPDPAASTSSDPADRVARDAARRLATGSALDEDAAVDAAQRELGLPDAWPSRLRVRRHLEGMQQQAMGAEAWRAARTARLRALEELLTLLEEHALGDRVLVVGRAARGHFTGTDPVRLRVYTDRPVRAVAAALELGGIAEIGFQTEETDLGRLDGLRFDDEEVGEVLLVRLPTTAWADRERNLYRREPVPIRDLAGVRRRLAEEEQASGRGAAGMPAERDDWAAADHAAADHAAADRSKADQSAAENAASSSAKEG